MSLCVLFGSILGCPNVPKQHKKLLSGCFHKRNSVDYFPAFMLENKPLTKSLGPFL
jgi:hypothetical protein